jgi:hypothetical protein
MEDAMRKGLLGWARAAAIMVASIPTSFRREEITREKEKHKKRRGVRK